MSDIRKERVTEFVNGKLGELVEKVHKTVEKVLENLIINLVQKILVDLLRETWLRALLKRNIITFTSSK